MDLIANNVPATQLVLLLVALANLGTAFFKWHAKRR
jgi:hypothetical protein